MIRRKIHQKVKKALMRQAAVALLGPRQVGKTTLAKMIASEQPSLYLDLESSADREKLRDPRLYLDQHQGKLVIFDEIHRMPRLFEELRGIIDERRFKGKKYGHFLILGSASLTLIKQSSESLAGRIEYIELEGLTVQEVVSKEAIHYKLWLRGGFPESYLASSQENSMIFRKNFLKSYAERDIPQLSTRIPADTIERFLTMLAHHQGSLLNASRLASSLSLSAPTITSYVSLMVDLFLVRKLNPYHANVGKRLSKSSKIYLRDTGLLHALLNIKTKEDLFGHPIIGPSFESFVIENILNCCSSDVTPYFYRTIAGAEVDLVLDWGGKKGLWAVEIKKSLDPKPSRGFFNAIEDLKPQKTFILYAGVEHYPYQKGIDVIGLNDFINLVN